MSEDGEKDQDGASDRPSRPDTAAGRRARRSSARPVGAGARGSSQAGVDKGGDTAKRSTPKGKSSEQAAKPEGKGRPTPKRNRQETQQATVFARIGRFIREVWAELRKVIWPTRRQMVTYTTVVLFFVAFMISLVTGLDLAFLEGMDFVFGE